MIDLLTVPYLYRPLLMLLALSCASGVVGVLIHLRRAEFTAETFSHAVFPGVVIGFITAGTSGVVWGGAVAGAVAAALLTVCGRQQLHDDNLSAILLSSLYALGMLISLRHSDKSGQLEALMFGRLLELGQDRLVHGVAACAIAVVLLWATWPAQHAVAFDRTSAAAGGISLFRVDAVFNAAVAATVVAGAAAVGILLVVGFLCVPPAAARLLTNGRALVFTSVSIAVLSSVLSMWVVSLPHERPVSPQALVALTVVLGLVVGLSASGLRKRRKQ
ncbi:metal ABC transporter permease [Staphylococcus chromogenes]|nr:metal ABC transporter permease [Staphylococcus chromogenes]